MPIDKASVLKQIDDVLAQFEVVEKSFARHSSSPVPFGDATWIDPPAARFQCTVTQLIHTIERFRPPGTSAFSDQSLDNLAAETTNRSKVLRTLAGVLYALRAEYEADRLQSFRELVHADLFADFLEMADYLLESKFKDAAAVMAGGVLEEHLRKLCSRHSIPTTFTNGKGKLRSKMIDAMNTALTKAGICNKIENQSVTAWAAIRNAAAHREYEKYTLEQVRGLIEGIREFIGRHPA